jgi:hypothetical protein
MSGDPIGDLVSNRITGADCPEGDELDPSQTQYFLEKPWKWTDEYGRMRAKESTE